ncbi:alpha/beta hydrolase [Roseospirillum parvum]|uniref:Alpha/beta hydrolase family protein n=1 Tax=Roseospirillum parvum TaxID=83401 RepID=A0A1G7U182_9PROT|nr:hypothetical protein [Roseospirillum parvum]SDG40809.1 hypothetical protein SAMN05421742_101159 [Roseospirillum parvum]
MGDAGLGRWLNSLPGGDLAYRLWTDDLVVPLLGRHALPLSRAWAAADAADGDPRRFLESLDLPAGWRWPVGPAVSAVARRAAAHRRAEAAWRRGLFEGQGTGDPAALEEARRTAAHAWMSTRNLFTLLNLAADLPIHGGRLPTLGGRLPAVRFAIPDPATVEARHGARLADPSRAFTADPEAEVAESRVVSLDLPSGPRATAWVRLDSGPAGPAWGRLEWPEGVDPADGRPRPVVILAHGICMEPEFWAPHLWFRAADLMAPLRRAGVVTLAVEGPWHGRRRLPGWYGGEPVLGLGPLGALDYFAAHVPELGTLTAWARRRFGGPVGFAGFSLGALTGALALSAAAHWPTACRPDAGLLIAPGGSVQALSLKGTLTAATEVPRALQAAGWTPARLDRWRPLLDPGAAPGIAPGRIVALIGEGDTVTLHDEAEALVARWGVPTANRFIEPRGHFSAYYGLSRDPEPLHRLVGLLAAG